jgi:hypothetical protein
LWNWKRRHPNLLYFGVAFLGFHGVAKVSVFDPLVTIAQVFPDGLERVQNAENLPKAGETQSLLCAVRADRPARRHYRDVRW